MRVLRKKSEFGHIVPGSVLTIGNFDGLHVGHQEILRVANQEALARNTQVVVLTFEPHPVAVLFPERAPKVLTPLEQKLRLLESYTDGCVVVLEDSRELLDLSAKAFVKEWLLDNIRPTVIVEGHDFHFGAGRSGNVETLKQLGQVHDFEVTIVPPHQIAFSTGQTLRVSSTIVRYMLESGHVNDAAIAMGRPYQLQGKVIAGRGKGREIGYPTLNLSLPEQVIPAEGVYAGTVELSQDQAGLDPRRCQYAAVFSVGQAETFGDTIPLLIEAHVLEPEGADLQAPWMAMNFVQHLRNQHRYSCIHDLVQQIGLDCVRAREILAQKGQA